MAVMGEEPKFAADRMLGRLARWLRLLGVDVLWQPNLGGHELLRLARSQGRVMLTRDSRLRTARDVLPMESNFLREQLRDVLLACPFDPRNRTFSRCSRCNAPLRPLARDVVFHQVPLYVYASHERFFWCDQCGRIYWEGTHQQRMRDEIERLMRLIGADSGADKTSTAG
jgi:uncharacterized protein with PIN domain